MPKLHASFITMFKEPITTYLGLSIIARSQKKGLISAQVESILESLSYDHHLVDDTPYGGGPGELLKINVIAPLINQALLSHPLIDRKNKRVLLMDPAGQLFTQNDAKRLSNYEELIFVCGRYEGIDARVHHYVDEALSIGDFVLSAGDLAAMSIFDATVRMIDGVLGNDCSKLSESHIRGRLESSHYTRPDVYDGHAVPEVLKNGHHAEINRSRSLESIYKTSQLRPDLIEKYPLDDGEQDLLKLAHRSWPFPWQNPDR